MPHTPDDIALALVPVADRRREPTIEDLVSAAGGMSRRERAVLAHFFEQLAEREREAARAPTGATPRGHWPATALPVSS
ncbi:hypothetical protein [Leifsonia sp. LS-T14]|uniref:hypothetical protein n=1 Tax=unclassified Leifsonia TaxID=2663824 RepID=UPI0035A6EB21